MIAHHFKNISAMQTSQPKTVKYIKTKFNTLQKVCAQHEENAEYLGGYRIEGRFVCKSLTKLIRKLKERTFKLVWVKNEVSLSRNGAYFDDNEWVPLTFTVRQFLDNIRHALVQFPIVFQDNLCARDENHSTLKMSSAILDLC